MADSTAAKKTSAKRSATKKSPAKKSSAKKTTASKTPATRSSADEAPAKKSTSSRSRKTSPTKATAESAPARKRSDRRSGERTRRGGSGGGTQMAGAAVEIVRQLTGKSPESVTGLQRSDDGWRVAVDVLELERIPSTTDVLATYEVTLDDQGELQGCSRVHRYLRGSPGDE
jgi:Gas vesicle synthesis protein GvpO